MSDMVATVTPNGGTTLYYETLQEAVADALADSDPENVVNVIGMVYFGDTVTLPYGKTVEIVYKGGSGVDAYDYHEFIRVEAEPSGNPETTNYINVEDDGTAYTFTCTSGSFTIAGGDVSVSNGTDGANYIKDSYTAAQTVSVPVVVSGGDFYGVNFSASFDPQKLAFSTFTSAIDGVTYEPDANATAGTVGGTLYSSVPIANGTTVGTLTFNVAANTDFDTVAQQVITINAEISPDYNRAYTLSAQTAVNVPVAFEVTLGAYVGEALTPDAASALTAAKETTTVIDASAAETTVYVVAGTQLTLAQTAAEGYEFINFTSNVTGQPVTASETVTFTVPTSASAIKANYYRIFTVTVNGTGVTPTVYKVRGGMTLGASDAIVTATGHDTLTSDTLEGLVDTTKYILRNWTFGTDATPVDTTALLAKMISADVTVTANTSKWYAVTQSTQNNATHQVDTTGASATTTGGNAYSNEAYTITLADVNAGGTYNAGYTYTITVTKGDQSTLASGTVLTSGENAGKYTIPAATLEVLDAGETLTISVIKTLDINVKVYYEPAVRWAAAANVTKGTGDGFAPHITLDRAMSVTFLYRTYVGA